MTLRDEPLPLGRLCVMQVIPELDAGGAEQTTVDISSALVKEGHRSIVVTQGGRLAKLVTDAGGIVVFLPVASKMPWRMAINSRHMRHLIERHHVSVVHARSRAPAWSAYWAAGGAHVPFVTTYHGTYNAKSPLKRFYNGIMVRGRKVIANSEFIADHIQREHKVPPQNIVTIPRGFDPARFAPNLVECTRVRSLREAWGAADGDRFVILLPGRLTRWKGQTVLIEALAQLKDEEAFSFTAILAGDAQGRSDYVDELKALIDRFGLGDRVRIVGHCADMPAAYAAADLVISASTDPEAFGRIAVEAQAMGRPVIVTDHGGARETVVDGKTGWRVPPGDVKALASKIYHVFQLNDEQKNEICSQARDHVLSSFTVNEMSRKTIELYKSIVSRKI